MTTTATVATSPARVCREYVRQMGLVVAVLQRLPREAPGEHLPGDLVARFRKETAGG